MAWNAGVSPDYVGPCFHCKEPMWMTEGAHETYLRNGQTFYCTHGHPQVFAKGKTELDKARDELAAERRQRQRAEQRVAEYADEALAARASAQAERNRANGYKGFATRITKRAKAGVCPCCNRHFTQLQRHMATKHPTFTPLEIEQGAPTLTEGSLQ